MAPADGPDRSDVTSGSAPAAPLLKPPGDGPGQQVGELLTRFAAMLRNSDELVAITDQHGSIEYLSPSVERVVGWRAEQLLGSLVVDLLHHEDLPAWAQHRTRLLSGPAVPVRGEVRARSGDGGWRWLQVTSTDLTHVAAVGGVVHNVRDVTATRTAERSFAAVVGSLEDTVARFDRELRHVFVNQAVTALTGVAPDAFIGKRHRDLAGVENRVVERWEQALRLVFATGAPRDLELDYVFGAETRWLWSRLTAEVGASGEVEHVVVVGRDVTERRVAEDGAARAALHDPLTGLANRALLMERLHQSLAVRPRPGRRTVVLFCDLDRLKLVNDSLGHAGGDELLVSVAGRLRALVRPADTLARLGGDEFVLCATVVDDDAGRQLGERIVEALAAPFDLVGGPVHVSASVGLAAAVPSSTAEGLLADADAAMYDAKRSGGNAVRRSPGSAGSAALDRLGLERDLHAAVAEGRLELRFRPVVSLTSDGLVGADAVVRWLDPARGEIEVAALDAIVEGSAAAAGAVGSWITSATVAWISDQRPAITTWLSLGRRQLLDVGVVAPLSAALVRTGIAPRAFGVRVSGAVLLEDGAVQRLQAFADLGVRIALDGVGTGPVPLTALRRLPLDVVRLDASLLDAADDAGHGADISVLAVVVDLAKASGLTVVADGVATTDDADLLRGLGCDAATGPGVAAVVDAATLGRHLAERRPSDRRPLHAGRAT